MINTKLGECFIVSGLQYGDEGKGTIVDYIVKEKKANMVVRYGGGPQAAHHVVKPDGTWHCFSHYGSGMFWEQSKTVLSEYMIVYPQTLERETQILQTKTNNPVDRLYIDTNCYILTPYHQMVSRVLEILRSKKKGSTGLGVGQVAEEIYKNEEACFPKSQLYDQKINTVSLQIKDLLDEKLLESKLWKIANEKKEFAMSLMQRPIDQVHSILYPNFKLQENQKQQISYDTKKLVVAEVLNFIGPNSPDNVRNALEFYKEFVKKYKNCFVDTSKLIKQELLNGKIIVFEGSQGALLDLIYGFYPHTTKTICTSDNVDSIINKIGLNPKITKIGVLRCYSHRHGEGPFIPYDDKLTDQIPELHNKYSKWQGNFKIGYLDRVALKYGIDVFQPDVLAVTSLDRIKEKENCYSNVCVGYSIRKDKINHEQRQIIKRRFEHIQKEETLIISKILRVSQQQAFKNYQLTSILNKCQPIYEPVIRYSSIKQQPELSTNKFSQLSSCNQLIPLLNFIQQTSQRPIYITSHSPTWQGKTELKIDKKV